MMVDNFSPKKLQSGYGETVILINYWKCELAKYFLRTINDAMKALEFVIPLA